MSNDSYLHSTLLPLAFLLSFLFLYLSSFRKSYNGRRNAFATACLTEYPLPRRSIILDGLTNTEVTPTYQKMDSTRYEKTEGHGVVYPRNYAEHIPTTPCWEIAPPLALGNAVIVEPSEKSPSGTLALSYLVQAAGLPAGIFDILSLSCRNKSLKLFTP